MDNGLEPAIVYDDLETVKWFVHSLNTSPTPVRVPEAHTLLLKAPQVKAYLKNKWKLNQLDQFFQNFDEYFSMDGGILQLKYELDVEELDCVCFFYLLLERRDNIKINVSYAHSFINSPQLLNCLGRKYLLDDLTNFFRKHSAFFLVCDGCVSLRHYGSDSEMEGAAQARIPKVQKVKKPAAVPEVHAGAASWKPNPNDERFQNIIFENEAVAFYHSVIAANGSINSKQAHSYLQGRTELREYLKRRHKPISDLGPFFKQHPDQFEVRGKEVYSRLPFKANVTGNSGAPAVKKANPAGPDATPKGNVILGSAATTKAIPAGSDAAPKLPPVWVFRDPKSQTVKPFSHDAGLWSSPSSSVSSGSSKVEKVVPPFVSNNTNLERLLSLVMDCKEPTSNVTGNSSSNVSKGQDVACQTVSSGPILSLNVFQEIEKAPG